MMIALLKNPDAVCYQVRCGEASAGGGFPASWTDYVVTNIKQAAAISGLMPGAAYVFQVRAITKAGYSDWSDPVTRFAV